MNNLDVYTFYFDLPLYTKIIIDNINYPEFEKLLEFSDRVDAYSPSLKENTTYSVAPLRNNNVENFYFIGGWSYSTLTCLRTRQEFKIFFHFDVNKKELQKIGQFPSIADLHISKVKKYDKLLKKEKLKEFTRAIGLAANGIGIGSFVYLRRIFEDLIEESHIEAEKLSNWDEKLYSKGRIPEKIGLLKDFLPDFLVKNKKLYSILSKGIHELSEEECLVYFETVKVGIELILDEKFDLYQKEQKILEARKKITSVTSIITPKDNKGNK